MQQQVRSGGRQTAAVVAALIAGVILSLIAVDNALATSEIGRNVGRELSSWGTWLLLAVAGLVALPVMAQRDFIGILVIAAMVIVAGGFVFAPGAVTDMIVSLWQSFKGGR